MATSTGYAPLFGYQVTGRDAKLLEAHVAWSFATTWTSNLFIALASLGRLPLNPALARLMIRGDLADWRRLDEGHEFGAMRRRYLGIWKLFEVAEDARHMKGKRDAEATFDLVSKAIAQRPETTRRELLELLMMYLEGRDALFRDGKRRRRSTGDPVYKAAYKKADRRLQRGFRLAGEPAEMRHLV